MPFFEENEEPMDYIPVQSDLLDSGAESDHQASSPAPALDAGSGAGPTVVALDDEAVEETDAPVAPFADMGDASAVTPRATPKPALKKRGRKSKTNTPVAARDTPASDASQEESASSDEAPAPLRRSAKGTVVKKAAEKRKLEEAQEESQPPAKRRGRPPKTEGDSAKTKTTKANASGKAKATTSKTTTKKKGGRPKKVKEESEPEDEEEYEVETILSHRDSRKGREYEVKWDGYEETTWEPASNFTSQEMIDEYEKRIAADEKGATSKTRGASAKKPAASKKAAPKVTASKAGGAEKKAPGRPGRPRRGKAA